MQRRIKYQSRAAQIVLGICGIAVLASTGHAQSFGLNFQNGNYGFGPWFVSDFGSAYGVAGDDWYNSELSSSIFDPNAVGGAVSFSSPSMNGASASLAWASSNALQGATVNAYGWSHANEPTHPSNGLPQSGEEAVLGGWVFAQYNANSGQGARIQVKISGLDGVAAAAGVPLSYQVKLLASNDWGTADTYTPAMLQDNASNSELVNFTLVDFDNDSQPDHPRWNETYFSSGGFADSNTLFTGDTLNITIAGPNESGTFDQPGYTRTALAGVAVYFVPPAAIVPEPSSLAMVFIGGWLLTVVAICRRLLQIRVDHRSCRCGVPSRSALQRVVAAGLIVVVSAAASARAESPSFGINFDNDFFSGMTPANFGSAFSVPGQNWYNTLGAVSDDDPNADASGVVSYSAPSLNGASLSLKWTSDRFWGEPSPVYGFTHANVDPSDPSGQTGLGGAGVPLTGEEAVLKGSLISTYQASTGLGEKIQITIGGLAAAASAAGVPLEYQVKVIGSEWGLPKSFYLPPYTSTNPALGYSVQNFAPATVSDNASHSESVAMSTPWANTPTWNPPPIDSNGPYYSSAASGDSTTVFTGDTLTITLDGPFDFGGAWGDANYGVTRLSGVAVYFVGTPTQTGDFDSDGDVDGADFVAWQTHYPTASGATQAMGDADGNGTVDGADFAIWQSGFPTAPSPTAAVPEPSAILLFVVGACGLAGYRRRQRLES